MDWKYFHGLRKPGPRRVPQSHFLNYYSPGFAGVPADTWLTGRFSLTDENILFVGSDTGSVCVFDVDSSQIKYHFKAYGGVVMDVIPVPTKSDEILTMNGYDVNIWTLGEPIKSSLYFGHDNSVRCANFAPNNPHVFSTGDRGGCICMWDRRVAMNTQNGNSCRRPVKVYKNCHLPKKTNNSMSGSGRRRSERIVSSRPPSITSLLYLDEYTLITASSCAKSGIRVWDTRRMPVKEESRPLYTLEIPYISERGISSISLDRYGSSLFAACTDNCVYEFSVNSANFHPIRSFVGATIDKDFYTQISCSPVSDHILCGSGTNQGILWDLQPFNSYSDTPLYHPSSISSTSIQPSFTLNGHERKVSNVAWSHNAQYMVTMDDSQFRVWRHLPSSNSEESIEQLEIGYERVERVIPPKEETASTALESISITPGPRLFLSPTKAGMAPLLKRKEPFTSPFKKSQPSSSTRLFSLEDIGKENIPPGDTIKILKLDDVKEDNTERRKNNPFYYQYPTMHLPNLVYERYMEKLKGGGRKPVVTETITKSGRKVRTEEWWTRTSNDRLSKIRLPSIEEFPDSAWSQVGSTLPSPKKLNVRTKSHNVSSTPKGSRRSSARNILDYFQRNK